MTAKKKDFVRTKKNSNPRPKKGYRIFKGKLIKVETSPVVEVPRNTGGRPVEWTPDRIDKEAEALEKWAQQPENYFITKFLFERKLDTAHIDRFSKTSDRFRLALERAKKAQEFRLVEMAVTETGNPGFIKFVLQNKAGWKDRNEISGDAANPLSVIMDRVALNNRSPIDDYDLE